VEGDIKGEGESGGDEERGAAGGRVAEGDGGEEAVIDGVGMIEAEGGEEAAFKAQFPVNGAGFEGGLALEGGADGGGVKRLCEGGRPCDALGVVEDGDARGDTCTDDQMEVVEGTTKDKVELCIGVVCALCGFVGEVVPSVALIEGEAEVEVVLVAEVEVCAELVVWACGRSILKRARELGVVVEA
jgi:hypothetical protein